MKKIIGIGGKKRAGKSSLAKYIIQAAMSRGWQVEEVSFAEPIKRMLHEVFRYEVPWSTFLEDSRKQDKVEIVPGFYMTVRELLQKVGTECFRDVIHKDFWVARGMTSIMHSSSDIIVVPDVRFTNELVALNNVGTTIFVNKITEEILPVDNHPTEKELDTIKHGFNYFLEVKQGDMKRLEDFAKKFIQAL